MIKKSVLACLFATAMLSLSAHAADKIRMGVVVKVGGNAWFNAMEAGIKSEAAKLRDRRVAGRADQCGSGVAGACD